VRVRWQRRGSDLSASTFSSLLSACLHALALAEAQDRLVYASAVSSEPDGLLGWPRPLFARPPISMLAHGLAQTMAVAICAQLSASFGLPSQRERGRAPSRARVRADGHVGDGRTDLDSIGSVTEVASHPSDDSCGLLSIPSDAEPGTPEPTKAGDVAVLDVAEGERLSFAQRDDQTEDIAGGLAARPAAHDGAGGDAANAVAPRRHGGRGTARARAPRPRESALIARLSALAARAQPLLTLDAASPGGSSGSGSSIGHSGFASPVTHLSPYAERPRPFVPAPGMPPRLPSALAAAAATLARAPDVEGSSDLEAAVEVLARPRALPPRVLRHQRSFTGADEVRGAPAERDVPTPSVPTSSVPPPPLCICPADHRPQTTRYAGGADTLRPPPEDVLQEPAHRISVTVPLPGGMCLSRPRAATR
jgi:hypothetical protein